MSERHGPNPPQPVERGTHGNGAQLPALMPTRGRALPVPPSRPDVSEARAARAMPCEPIENEVRAGDQGVAAVWPAGHRHEMEALPVTSRLRRRMRPPHAHEALPGHRGRPFLRDGVQRSAPHPDLLQALGSRRAPRRREPVRYTCADGEYGLPAQARGLHTEVVARLADGSRQSRDLCHRGIFPTPRPRVPLRIETRAWGEGRWTAPTVTETACPWASGGRFAERETFGHRPYETADNTSPFGTPGGASQCQSRTHRKRTRPRGARCRCRPKSNCCRK